MSGVAPENLRRAEDFHKIHLLVNQLSDPTSEEVAKQLSILVDEAESKAKGDLCGQIARHLFNKATLETTNPACLRLYAQLCHRLKLIDAKNSKDEISFKPSALVSKNLYRLCDDFFEDASWRTQSRVVDAGRGTRRTPNETKSRNDSAAPERVILFLGELFEANILPAARLQDYVKSLIKSKTSISLESRVTGLSQLVEAHGRLDSGPLRDTMNLIFAWIEGITEGALMAKQADPQLLNKLKVSILVFSGF